MLCHRNRITWTLLGPRAAIDGWTAGAFCVLLAVFGFGLVFRAQNTDSSKCVWVLDFNQTGRNGAILGVDPSTGTVLKTIPTGHAPQLAVSPDGNRLYIDSRDPGRHEDTLTIVDAGTGRVLQSVSNPDSPRWGGPPPTSLMATSADGHYLYILKGRTTNGKDSTWVAAFDTQASAFLATTVPMGDDCPGASLRALPAKLMVVCGGLNTIYSIPVGADGSFAQSSALKLPPPSGILPNGIAHAEGDISATVWSTNGGTLFLVKADGSIVKLSTQNLQITKTSTTPLDQMLVASREGVVSPDGSRLFVGCRLAANRGHSNQYVVVFDTESLQLLKTVPVSQEFLSLAMSPYSEELLLTVPRNTSGLLVVDTSTLRESRMLRVGVAPAYLRY